MAGYELDDGTTLGAYDKFYDTCFSETFGKARRSAVINPAESTLVLIICGQSQMVNITPTIYNPKNAARIDNFNIYDGGLYEMSGPLLGVTYNRQPSFYGLGNAAAYLCDHLAKRWDRVIAATISVGGTSIRQWGLPEGDSWDNSGVLYRRAPFVLKRLAEAGITPATPGVTFGCLVSIGETDNVGKTTVPEFVAGARGLMQAMASAGFAGRFFFSVESWFQSKTSDAVREAQRALIDNTGIFSAGDLDALGDGDRYDHVHFSDAGAAAAGRIIFDAMCASGQPY